MVKIAEVSGHQLMEKLEKQDEILRDILIQAQKTNGTLRTHEVLIANTSLDLQNYKKGMSKMIGASITAIITFTIAITGWIIYGG